MPSDSRELATGSFAYSHHVQFAGPVTFTENTLSHNTSFHGGDGLTELYKRCSKESIFDSQMRDLPPPPHGGYLAETNLRRIRRWGNRIDGPSVLWLNGPTQTGKTAMAQQLAEEWAEQDRLVATYMFSAVQPRTPWGLSKDDQKQLPPIILTLAFQLARARLDIADHIRNIYNRDPSIYDSVIQKQFRELNVRPLQASEPELHPVIIIVDALEKCDNTQTRLNFLDLFRSTVTSEVSGRLKLFLCSRMEPNIETRITKLPVTRRLIIRTSNAPPNINITAHVEDTKYDCLIDLFRIHRSFAGVCAELDGTFDHERNKTFADCLHRVNIDAMFESSSRPNVDFLDCTARTVINRIHDWGDNSSGRPVLWLSGSIGSGKSCIAQTLAREWGNSRAVATFDFRVGVPFNFFATCAYQLFRPQSPIYDAWVEWRICTFILHNYPMRYSSTLDEFETLITPFIKQESRPAIILIDGLDECIYSQVRDDVLQFIASYTKTSASPTVKFLISSRPQREIRQIMEEIFIAGRLEKASLGRTREADSEIAKYLEMKFSNIQKTIPSFHYDDTVVPELVQRSAGLFIFAATVASYVGDAKYDPGARLDNVMNISTPDNTQLSGPLEYLDALYVNILENSGSEPGVLTKLLRHALMCCTPSSLEHRVKMTEYWFDPEKPCSFYPKLDPEACDLSYLENYLEKLRPLKPLLILPESSEEDVLIRHASFGEFLQDKTRSKQFYVKS